jgi:Flp pilus assembly protein TadG
MRPWYCRFHSRGVAIVEFAIALPFLLMLMLVTAEFGRLLSQYDTLTKAARSGARYVASNALQGSTGVISITPQVQTAAQNLVIKGNVGGTGTTLLPGLVAANVTVTSPAPNYVSVSASYPYQPMVGAILPTFGFTGPLAMNYSLTVSVMMRAL